MNIILKLKGIYYRNRKRYCVKQYNKYLSLLNTQHTFYGFSKNPDYYYYNDSRYKFLCKKYKNKCLFFSKKLQKILFYQKNIY